jgi:proteic killer suppression protein
VIKSFADNETKDLGNGKISGSSDVEKRAVRKLRMLDSATSLQDLRFPPGNKLHQLKGDRAGRWSLRVNNQYAITFRFENGDAYDVKFEDYH